MHHSRFTLTELLVVMAIIGILAAMLMPALSGARDQAKRTTARSEIQSLKTAITSYESTYGVLPAVSSVGSNDTKISSASNYDNFIKLLQNYNTSGSNHPSNPRGIRFLDIDTPGAYQDPWAEKKYADQTTSEKEENNYKVVLDYSYTEQLKNGENGLGSSDLPDPLYPDRPQDTLFSQIAIWSKGKNRDWDAGEDPKSW